MLQIDPMQFLIQAAILAGWVIFAVLVYTMVERQVSGLSEHATTTLTVYVLWLFMGTLGAHRIACKHILSGLAQLLLTFVLFLASLAFGNYHLFAILPLLWWLYDATQIPSWIKDLEATPATAPSN